MARSLPAVLNVLVIAENTEAELERIKSVAPDRLNIVPVWRAFRPELEREWSANIINRSGPGIEEPERSAEELESLVREAHVVLLSLAHPRTLPLRAPNLIWGHFPFAGVSNLMDGPWWGTRPMVTTCRGVANARAVAESALAAALMCARHLNVAVEQTRQRDFSLAPYEGMQLVVGKTMGIIGLGGIGSHLATMARGCGMRIIATRRSATTRQRDVDGVDELFPPEQLAAMLAESDFITVCPALTPETERMVDSNAFRSIRKGAYFINIGRGEIVETEALVQALRSGQLAGAYLDVWDDDTGGALPSPDLLAIPTVICSPHVSSRSGLPRTFVIDLFCENLERLLRGDDLINVIDWSRGY